MGGGESGFPSLSLSRFVIFTLCFLQKCSVHIRSDGRKPFCNIFSSKPLDSSCLNADSADFLSLIKSHVSA